MIILVMLLASLPVAGSADETVARYFPADAWGKPIGPQTQAEESQYYEKRFGGHLAAMKEPSLAFAGGSDRGPNEIRLLFLPSFDPGSMLRISYSDKQEVSFEFKKLSGAGGSTPGDLRVHSTGTVDEGDADRIFALLDTIDPWSDAIPPVFARSLCMDGTRTVLEFRKRDAYKVIQRHGCDLVPDDDIRKLIHVLNDVSDGQMIAPHTFEPIDWMKGFDREDLKDYWDRLEKDRRDRRERNLRIRMGYPD